MLTAPAKDNRGSVGYMMGYSANWEYHFFTPGQLILNTVDDDIQVAGFVDEIQVIGANGEHRAYIEGLQPLPIECFKQLQIFG